MTVCWIAVRWASGGIWTGTSGLVHLKDSLAQKIDYHYHEFDKLVIFLGGKVTYVVEGVTYFLKRGTSC